MTHRIFFPLACLLVLCTACSPKSDTAVTDPTVIGDANDAASAELSADKYLVDQYDYAAETLSEIPESFPDDDAIRILAWNIESDGANADVIAEELKALPKYDLYGFSEVRELDFAFIRDALGDEYACSYSKTGYDDRLAYAIRKDRLQIENQFELAEFEGHVLNPGNYRSPYVTEVKDLKTDKTFLVMVNHLARGKAEVRQQQAEGLRQWAKSLDKPLIAIGDYNFDYVFNTDRGNEAFDVFMKEDVFTWVKPVPMVDSNWFDGNGDGVDDYPGSLLDFCFVAGEAKIWDANCRVLVRQKDFPDDKMTSDHRPIELTLIAK